MIHGISFAIHWLCAKQNANFSLHFWPQIFLNASQMEASDYSFKVTKVPSPQYALKNTFLLCKADWTSIAKSSPKSECRELRVMVNGMVFTVEYLKNVLQLLKCAEGGFDRKGIHWIEFNTSTYLFRL